MTAKIYEISPTGNLTIQFNKSIIVPKITQVNEDAQPTRMLLSGREKDEEPYFYDIDNLIEMKMESDFYTEEMREIQIYNYTLTRITPKALDI